jgi:3-dehydroquinate synthase
MIIHSKFKEYSVIIENDLKFLERLQEIENTQFVIDKKVYDLYNECFQNIPYDKLILMEALETNKIIDTALDICEKMTDIPAKRNAHIVSVGGGIIQDVTGFVANIMYRGIKWTFVPTTLLASCDSCIGGKTSLNYKRYKNLLGTFYPPDEIHICSAFFQTLSEKDYKSGLGEVVKFNIMAGEEGLANIETNIEQLLNRSENTINRFVESSLAYKKTFIEIDEFDRGERIKLNFAHTFGHAIEVVTNYVVPHGTAVAIGMIMADAISVKRGILNPELSMRAEDILMKIIDIDFSLFNFNMEQYLAAIRKDKKQTNTSLTAVLRTDENGLEIIKDMKTEEVAYAMEYFIQKYTELKRV